MCVMRGAGNTGERWRHGRAGIQECDGQVRGGAELIWSGCAGRGASVGVRWSAYVMLRRGRMVPGWFCGQAIRLRPDGRREQGCVPAAGRLG